MSRTKRTTRAYAKARGLQKYHGGSCQHCGGTERYTGSGNCVECDSTRHLANPGRSTPYVNQYRKEHPAEAAESKALSAARSRCKRLGLPEPLPAGYDRSLLMPLFRRLVALRKKHPEREYELDHIHGLRFGHHAGNLQILTKAAHQRKTARERRAAALT